MFILKKKYVRSKLKHHVFFLLYALFYWNVAIRLALFIQWLGYKSENTGEMLTKGMVFMHDRMLGSSIIISVFAILTWYIQNFVYPSWVRKYHIKRLTPVFVLFDTAIFVLIGVLLGLVHYSVDKGLAWSEVRLEMGDFLFNSTILFFFTVMFVGSYVYQLLITLFRQIGFGKLGRVMMGYYQKPREENRIFLFLDLKSSTTFAEELGHEQYSYFIQDCFKILSNPLLLTQGVVYQFVGDEVVVTWEAHNQKNFKKAVDFFFLFQKELEDNRSYFEDKYNMVPIFSASINSGKVMSAEVGEIKTELAYHGDVLNTAARIQKQCKQYNKDMLVTENFALTLNNFKNGYEICFVDHVMLKGKAQKVRLYEVSFRN
ncbi:adenylate/guanylate cyclase domain-containing protein [Plebeiibacterium marinum]|uniref:Adenylate/guanylate cyclase domain-containing protein n=1 Tax=Plebeiibacterium marinum TaxID=2992111 RepID=A0AAE3MEQ1_9BACT|nr:adenylate/guanylate cyclase domain-containing protein [Plebeiobacterium marinum]MCW3806583.1 adenylate/guanylate cyclase domain-containing protein [Plebeiobacterium marinum]